MDARERVGENGAAVEIRLLGRSRSRSRVAPSTSVAGARALVAVLALHAGEVVSTDRLIDALWGEQPPPTAGKSLQNHVSRVRSLIGSGGETVLVTRTPGYVLAVEDDAVDARRFARLVDAARAVRETDPAAARELLGEALGLWRGEALAEFAYESFAQTEIARLNELRLSALEDRIDADLALGLDDALVPELQALVAAHPTRERLLGQLMLALYRSGRQTEALEAYRAGREALDRDLGLEPGPALRALEQAILAQDPELGPARRPPPSSPAPPGRRRRRRLVVAGLLVTLIVAAAVAALVWAVSSDSTEPPEVVPDTLVKIDVATNEIVDVIPVGRNPGQVEALGDYVFVASESDGTVERIDVRSGKRLTSGALAASGQLAGAGQYLWVTSTSRHEVVRVRAASLGIVDRVPLEPDRAHAFIAVGGGSLWISQYPSPAVIRWQLRTLERQRRYTLNAYEFPVEVTYAEGGAWVGVESDLLRIDGASGATSRVSVGLGASDPVFGFGSIWVGSVSGNAVWRVDAITERAAATIPVDDVTFGLAVGGGSVWVSNHCHGKVSRIDPVTNREVATIETGYFPRWLAVSNGYVWVGISGKAYDQTLCLGRGST